jgi:Ca-activated chloride channel homolog
LEAMVGEPSWKGSLRQFLLPFLRGLAIVCAVIALARPQQSLREEDIKADGIDIILAMDVSSSMLAQDFKPDRLAASKEVAKNFVGRREFDRIGLVIFSAEAFTQCPLTTDHDMLNNFLDNINCCLLEDGTAIGMGLATAANRLKDSQAKSKVVILLTDGVNNSGYVPPTTAAELAKTLGVKVYTIGVGNSGQAYTPVRRRGDCDYIFGFAPVEIDENLLIQIAQTTGGRYFRAKDEKSLEKVYAEIDRLEKTELDITAIKRDVDVFHTWLKWAIALLLIEIILRWTLLRALP